MKSRFARHLVGACLCLVLSTQAVLADIPHHSARGHARGSVCTNALDVDTSVNGKDDHADQISGVSRVDGIFDGKRVALALEYQTYGGKEYIAFLTVFGHPGTLGALPLFPFHGDVFETFQSALSMSKTEQAKLNYPFSVISKKTVIARSACASAK